jgi:hypothetical protein
MKPIRTARTNRAEPRPPLQEDQGNANGEDQEYVRAFIVFRSALVEVHREGITALTSAEGLLTAPFALTALVS